MLLIRSVVIHVALTRMTLAPGVFVRDDVLRFGKIGGTQVQRRDQVIRPPEFGETLRHERGRCGCSPLLPDGKFPVNGLTQAREPMPN